MHLQEFFYEPQVFLSGFETLSKFIHKRFNYKRSVSSADNLFQINTINSIKKGIKTHKITLYSRQTSIAL